MVRAAKAEGLPVTCEVTPHHLFLTEDNIGDDYSTALKVNPPLRTASDAEALIAGVADGTVDAIVTDHAPHTAWEKDREFELAPFGMIGLETSLGLVITNLVATGKITWERMTELMGANQRAILGVGRVALEQQGEELRLHWGRAHRPCNRRVRRRLRHHGRRQDRRIAPDFISA